MHGTCIFIKLEQLQIIFWSDHVTLVNLLVFSKDFPQLSSKYIGLWYSLSVGFFGFWTEVMTDIVLNRSRDVIEFLSWYCADTALNLRLVVSGIYNLRKRISEYYEYF